MPLSVSIVILIYSVDNNLFQLCMCNVLAQMHRDFEVIFVDDGFKDSSEQLCDNFAKKDSRVRAIHQENQGVSVDRNNGMVAAVGKYIMIYQNCTVGTRRPEEGVPKVGDNVHLCTVVL